MHIRIQIGKLATSGIATLEQVLADAQVLSFPCLAAEDGMFCIELGRVCYEEGRRMPRFLPAWSYPTVDAILAVSPATSLGYRASARAKNGLPELVSSVRLDGQEWLELETMLGSLCIGVTGDSYVELQDIGKAIMRGCSGTLLLPILPSSIGAEFEQL